MRLDRGTTAQHHGPGGRLRRGHASLVDQWRRLILSAHHRRFGEDAMQPGSVPIRLDRLLLLVLALALVVAGQALAAATGHHAATPHAATAVEYGL